VEARRAGEELKLAEEAFVREPTPERLARLRALQSQARAAADAGSAEEAGGAGADQAGADQAGADQAGADGPAADVGHGRAV
jgi:hypothetical protein